MRTLPNATPPGSSAFSNYVGRKASAQLANQSEYVYAERTLMSNGQLEEGMAMLTKPFGIDALAARVRDLVTLQKAASGETDV